MPALASDLRKTLENTVVKARDKAEGGARDALTALAVDASEPFGSMSEEERKLRNRLRARGRVAHPGRGRGRLPVHARRAEHDVPGPAVDDAAICRVWHRRGVQRALQVPARAGWQGAVRGV